jgi:hypothetical protein
VPDGDGSFEYAKSAGDMMDVGALIAKVSSQTGLAVIIR